MSSKDFVFNLLADTAGADRALDAFAKNADKVATAVAGAWAGAKIKDVLSNSFDIESAQAKMVASMGLLPDESARIGDAAGNLFAQNYGESLSDVNGAITAVIGSFDGMRDASQADLESMTGKAMTFADVMEVDVSRAAQVAGQMVKQGLAKDGTEAFDLLLTSFQHLPVSLREDLLDAVDEYGGFFSQLGIGGEQAMSMLLASSEKGMYGIDKTGDAIKEFATLITTDMGRTQPAIEALGLDYNAMANDLLAGGERGASATALIVDGLANMTDPLAQAQYAVDLFGTPIEDLGSDGIPKFLSSLQGVDGGLGDFNGSMDTAQVQLAATMDSMVAAKQKGLDQWVQGLVDVPGPMADVVSGFIAFGPAALEVLAAVGPMVALTGARIGATAAAGAGTAMNIPFAASLWATTWPILAIVAAIALLALGAYLLISNWDTIGPWLGELWEGALAGIEWFIGAVLDIFLTFHPLGIIIKNWGAITEWFGGFWSGIQDGAAVATEWLGGKVGEIVGFFTSIPDRVGDAWTGLVGLIQGVMRQVLSFTVGLWNDTLGQINLDLPWFLGGGHIEFPRFNIPALAEGGMVFGPTIALIGEAGPEAVVPLSKASSFGFGGGSGEVEVPVELYLDGQLLARAMKRINAHNEW